MFLRYEMDIEQLDKGFVATPAAPFLKLPFYVLHYAHYAGGEKYYTERDGLNNYLILLTLEGSGVLRYGGKDYTLKRGDVMLIDCQKRQFYATKCAPWRFKFMHFSGTAAPGMASLLEGEGLTVCAADADDAERAFDAVSRCRPVDTLDKALSASDALCRLLSGLYRASRHSAAQSGRHTAAMEQAAAYMHRRLADPVALDEVCRAAYLSKFHFARLFKQYSGLPPYAYLLSLRLSHAKMLLRGGDEDMESVAAACGFSSAGHFIRIFKKATGMTPLTYRQTAQA